MKPKAQLALFFVISFTLAWGTWIPAFLFPRFPKALSFIGLFAPAIAAVLVAGFTEGVVGVRKTFARYAKWRFGVRWYVLAIALMPAIYLLAAFLAGVLFHFSLKGIWTRSPIYFMLAAFLWLMFINSGEEIGWRGFAQPVLFAMEMRPATASVLLGVVWGLWHAPIYLIPGQSSFPYPLFLVLIVGLTFIYTGLFLKSNGSLLAAVLLHAGTDIGPRIMRFEKFNSVIWILVDLLVWIAAICFWYSWESKAARASNRLERSNLRVGN